MYEMKDWLKTLNPQSPNWHKLANHEASQALGFKRSHYHYFCICILIPIGNGTVVNLECFLTVQVAKDEDEFNMQQRYMQAQLQSNLMRMRANSSAPKLTVGESLSR